MGRHRRFYNPYDETPTIKEQQMLIDLILAVIAILVTGVVFNVIGNIASREN